VHRMNCPNWAGLNGEGAPGALDGLEAEREAAIAGGDLDRRAAGLAEQGRAQLFQRRAFAAEQEAAGSLAEERLLGRAAAFAQRLQVDAAADSARDRRLGQ